MDQTEQEAYDAVQAEKAELGISTSEEAEPTQETPEEPAAPAEEEPNPEATNTEEPKDFDYKEYKDFKKDLQEKLQADFDRKIEEIRTEMAKAKPDEATITNLEDDIQKLAEETELDPEKVKRIVEVSRKGLETLTREDKALLEEYKQDKVRMAEEASEREQQEIDRLEWEAMLPTIKKEFPNASEDQLAKAKAQLTDLSHDEKYHQTDIDYVYFKEREAIGKTLFSPRQATFESARPVSFDETEEFPDFNPNMTPAQFEAWEKKRERALDSLAPEKLRITTRDDGGHIIERYE